MSDTARPFRALLEEFIREQARPVDKFSHQARLYRLAIRVADGGTFDDDILYAAAWLHDLGVFIGHRPEDLQALAAWDHVAYVTHEAPAILERFGFPVAKVPAVLEAIRTHMPHCEPTAFEGLVLHDADILEQLGSVGILRTVSKVGRDTRFARFNDALRVLRHNLEHLPGMLRLESARRMARARIHTLRLFLDSADLEADNIEW
jgi:uncharacterized protein